MYVSSVMLFSLCDERQCKPGVLPGCNDVAREPAHVAHLATPQAVHL